MKRFFRISVFFFVLICLCSLNGFSQNGNIQVYQEPGIAELLNKHKAFYEKLDGIYGYRVQIFFESGNDAKAKANSAKAQFNSRYSEGILS